MSVTSYQLISASQEMLTAVRLISSGLGQLQALDDLTSDFYYLPMLSLHAGLERWLKITLCFQHLSAHGYFPPSGDFPRKNSGHDLSPLLQRVLAQCYTPQTVASNAYFKEDVVFLSSKPVRRFAQALSAFGLSARYYHLNVVLGEKPAYDSPEDSWDTLVGYVLDDNPDLKAKFHGSGFADEHLMTAIRIARAIIVRFGRSLARLVVLGALGGEAKRLTGYVWEFWNLSDDDLLNKQFSVFAKHL